MPKRCQSLRQWELGRVRIHPVVATGNKNKDRSHGKAWEERQECRSKWPTAMQTNLSITVNFEHLVNVQVVLYQGTFLIRAYHFVKILLALLIYHQLDSWEA